MANTDLYPDNRRLQEPSGNHDKPTRGKERTSINQKILDIFTTGKSNQEILFECNQVSKSNLIKILRQFCEKIVNQIERSIGKDHHITKARDYQSRRRMVVDELAGERRVDHNTPTFLGNSALRHFFKICKRFIVQGSLQSCNIQLLIKLHKKWFHSPIEKQVVEIQSKQKNDLLRKKQEVQKLRIQEQILKRKSEILKIEMEIEQLQESLNKKTTPIITSFCKQQEKFSEEDIQQREIQKPKMKKQIKPLKQQPIISKIGINSFHKSLLDKNMQDDTKRHKTTKAVHNKIIPPSQKEAVQIQDGGWKQQQQRYLLGLLVKFSFREQSTLINQMIKRFGKKTKFQSSYFRVKKYEMYKKCGQDFLKAVNFAKITSETQFQALSNHFNTIDNLKAYQFQTQFVRKYYFSNFGSFPQQTLREIVSIVWNQPTRVLKTNYLQKKSILYSKYMEDKKDGQQEDEKIVIERKKDANPNQKRKALKESKKVEKKQFNKAKQDQPVHFQFDEKLFTEALKDIINREQ